MKKIYFLVAMVMMLSGISWGQPWTYDFGTGTGSYSTASGSSTTFLTSTPTNGGTYRVRCASSGNQGTGFVLANPGTTLGTGSELQVNASITASTNKFGVYDWSSPSTVAYMKCKFRTTSSGNGNIYIGLGINTLVTDNNGFTSQYNNSLALINIAYTSGSISSIVRRISGGTAAITGSGLAKDADQIIEIYANNGSGSVNYTKSGTNTLATKTWDLWVDGSKVVSNAPTAGTLAAGTNLSGFAFLGESSTGNAAFVYIDDLEYSNALPAGGGLTPPTLTAAAGATVDNPFNVTFTDDAAWRAAITSIKVGATTLTAGHSVSAGQITFTPSASNPAALLQTAASPTITVSATGYNDATVTQAIGAGTAAKLAMKTQPAAPAANGGVLATQPAVYIQDQYGNNTSSTATVDAAVGAGTWTLGGTTSVAGVAGTTTYTGLTATSAGAVTGATIAFSSTGLTGVTSGTFDIPAPAPTITTSVATLTGFTYSQGAGPSTEKNFVVSGLNLTADISITPPADYEISTGTGGSFVATNPITLTQTGGTVTNTTIYVRLKAGLAQGTYSSGENIDISSTAATSKTVACSGDVSAPSAALPLIEDFSYTVGTDLTANGWNITGTNASPTVAVTAPSISYPGYLSSGVGNEVSMTVSGQDVNKTFTPQTSGTIYASCLVNISSVATGGDYFFHLGQNVMGSTFKGKVFAKLNSGNINFGVSQQSNTGYYSTTPTPYTLNTTYLVVLKYDIVAGTSNDVASIYINPPLNAPIPSSGWIVSTDAPSDPTDIGSVALRQGGTSAPTLKLDGIRISTVWADIVGAIPAPTITLGANATVCQGTTTANLTYSATVGFPDQYSIDYDAAAEAAGFVDVVNVSLPASPIVLTVPGAAAAGTYNAAVSVRNSSTGLASGSYSITITVSTPVGWANLQSPASGTICPSGTFTAYGRIWKDGVTTPAGAPAGITAELGFSTTNTDPSTWTNWQPATFNAQYGNDDEFMSTLSGLLPGTYYYAFRYQVSPCSYQYGGYNATGGNFWDGTSNVSGVLTVTGTSTLAASATCQSLSIGSGTVFTDGSCNAIARVVPSGATPVSGTVNSCVTVDATVQSHNGSPYVQRHFDIEPATNAATATGTVTLYVLQSEFDAYNLVRGALPSLPVSGSNADPNVSNIRVTQYHGTGTAPGSYSGTSVLLTPSVNWNGNYWEITVSVSGFSGFYIHSSIGGVLPVNLLTFSGHKQGTVNKLSWTTVSEQNNRGFAVERSSDGTNYTVIGFVNTRAVNGNSDASLTYSFTDANPAGSKQYYRLRQQDINGVSRQSNVIVIKSEKATTLAIDGLYPNPASSQLNVALSSPARGTVTLQVVDMTGRVLAQQVKAIAEGSNTVSLNVAGLSNGSYILKVVNAETGAVSAKFSKQ